MTQPLPLRDYQTTDLAFLIAKKRALLLHDPGGGKTPTACVWLYYQAVFRQKRSIWVMPKSLFGKNQDELLRFTNFTPDAIAVIQTQNDLVRALNDERVMVYLMTADRLRMSWTNMFERSYDIDAIAADEPHMYWSTNSSKRTQAFYQVAKRCRYFLGMTGTLITGRLDSAYPMIHAIEPHYYPSYEAFMAHHAIMDDYGRAMAWTNTDRIVEILSRHSIRRSFESIYGKEAKVVITERVAMSPKQRKSYEEFEEKAVLELEEDFLQGATGGVFTLRCRQIMAHPETWCLAEGEKTGKDELLEVHLANHQRTGKPLVIYASLVPEQERIAKLVRSSGMTVGLLNGNVSGANRQEIDRLFRAGDIQVVVGSPAVATVGFNWDHCDHVVFVSVDYRADTFTQAYRRCVRGVRATPLLITVLEYENSIDQRMFSILKRKSELESRVNTDREVIDLSA